MAEKQGMKKRGLTKRVFKWLFVTLLALLLIASIVFQAPWKVITLLLIVLAACTALPKPFRKWFWLSVAVVIIALIIWVFLPEGNGDWRPYTFDEELAALEATRAIPDEENAAIVYKKLLKDFDSKAMYPDFLNGELDILTRSEPWSSEDYPEVAQWLNGQQSTIATLLEAIKKEKFRFPIVADTIAFGKHMELLDPMHGWAYLLVRAANNDMAEGRIDAALEKYLCVIQMANYLYQQPVMIGFMVGFAIEHMALERLNRFVIEGQPSGKQLRLIANSIKGPKNNWSPDWQKILDFEKLYAKNMLCGMVYEVDSEGKIRLTRRSFASTIGQSPQQLPTGAYSRRKCAKLGVIFVWLYVPSAPEKIGEMVDASYEKYYAMTEPGFDWNKEPGESQRRWKVNYRFGIELLVNMNEQAYYRVHEIYLRNLSLRRGSRLLTAIKQYKIEQGNWPESLDVIKSQIPAEACIDPVTGEEFAYENHGKRFSLYGEKANIWPK